MTPSQLIAFLNAMNLGDLDGLRAKLAQARHELAAMGQPEIAAVLADAAAALGTADVRTFRKRIETAVARLGHLR